MMGSKESTTLDDVSIEDYLVGIPFLEIAEECLDCFPVHHLPVDIVGDDTDEVFPATFPWNRFRWDRILRSLESDVFKEQIVAVLGDGSKLPASGVRCGPSCHGAFDQTVAGDPFVG